MTGIEYAKIQDRQELLDFLLAVFRRNNPEHKAFDCLYPDLFVPNADVMARHAIIRENGRIAACVGAYRIDISIGGCQLPTIGIGQVATAAESLGKGYMTALLRHQLERGVREGAVLAWLGGRHDRYSRFGFDCASLSFDYACDAHSFGETGGTRNIVSAPPAEILTPELFELRRNGPAAVAEPFDLYMLQMQRGGFDFSVFASTPEGASTPDAWVLYDRASLRIHEWCGSLDGRAEIMRQILMAESGKNVWRMESIADKVENDFLRSRCTGLYPVSRMLAVLDADGLLKCLAPFVPHGYRPKAKGGCELVRELFGPGPGSPHIPFSVQPLFHV